MSSTSNTRNVLIIAPTFYPTPYVSSVRATQWAKWLPHHGWNVSVITRQYGAAFSNDRECPSELSGTNVYYVGRSVSLPSVTGGLTHSGARHATAIPSSILSSVLIPDPSIVQWRRARAEVNEIVKRVQPDILVTSSPSNSIHCVGMWISKEFPELPWVADFRDLFRRNGKYRHSHFCWAWNAMTFMCERNIYHRATRITCAIPTHVRWIRKRFPEAMKKTVLLLNGPSEYDKPLRNQPRAPAGRSVQVTILGSCGEIESMVVAQAIAHMRNNGADIYLRFVGTNNANKHEIRVVLRNAVHFVPHVPHDQAIEEIKDADILIAALSESRSRRFIVTSKVFEYLSCPVPVLIINPSRPDRRLFGKVKGVTMLTRPSVDDVLLAINSAMKQESDEMLQRSGDVVERFGRRAQAKTFSDILDTAITEHSR